MDHSVIRTKTSVVRLMGDEIQLIKHKNCLISKVSIKTTAGKFPGGGWKIQLSRGKVPYRGLGQYRTFENFEKIYAYLMKNNKFARKY